MDDMAQNHLSPRRHKTGDLFVADLFGVGATAQPTIKMKADLHLFRYRLMPLYLLVAMLYT